MKHNLKISVSNEPQTGGVVRCRNISLREKLLTLLLGKKERMMILIPGNSVAELVLSIGENDARVVEVAANSRSGGDFAQRIASVL